MEINNNYNEIFFYLEEQNYKKVLQSLSSTKEIDDNIVLFLIKLFCEIELNAIKDAENTLILSLKKYPKNEELKKVKAFLKQSSKTKNPLADIIHSFIAVNKKLDKLPKGVEFEKFMDFIIKKPFIK